MAGLVGSLTQAVVNRLSATEDGLNTRVAAMLRTDASLASASTVSFSLQNVSAEISDKAGQSQYPVALVYCDKVSNGLKEKFRQFSGKGHLVIELRHSQEKLENIENRLQTYVDAVCSLLSDSRGDWGGGLSYSGCYEVAYDAVTRGGRNFLQRARVGFDIEVSK